MANAKMDATYQDDLFNMASQCCITARGGTLASLPEIEYPTQSATMASGKPPALRPRPSSGMPLPSIPINPKEMPANGRATTTDENDGHDGSATPAPAAHKHFTQGQEDLLRHKSFDSLPARIANSPVAHLVAHQHLATGKGLAGEVVAIDRNKSLMDDDDGADDPYYADLPEDGTDTTCPESCPPSPYPALTVLPSPGGRVAPEDELALEVGLTAYEYLEECFFTEVSVLDRDKFNAIPEIAKSDFTITGHLGKGNFSDVFEVVRKGGQQAQDAAPPSATSPPPSSRRRFRRRSISTSVTTATLTSPSCGERRGVFALKCLRPGIRSDPEQFTIGAEDLVHETAILATLNHRNIIKLHGRASGELTDAFVLNDGYFILLDRLSETLYTRIENWKLNPHLKLGGPALQQIEVAHSVAEAMSYLHSKKIIFRDLKPDNVGFDASGVLKLFDFGFAVGLPEKDEDNPAGFLFDRCGTPRYMAPEVGLTLGYSLAADVYSYGIFLWEVCTLVKPFATITSASEFERAVFMGGERPKFKDPWPMALKELMGRCWSVSPSNRPADWRDITSSLSSLMNNVDDKVKSVMKTPVMSSLRRSMARRSSTTDGVY